MTLLVLGVGFFVPFVAVKTVMAQLMLRFERDDAFWVALAGHCMIIVAGAPLFALVWRALPFQSLHSTPSMWAVAIFYGCLVIPLDVWTAQGIVRGGSYPDLDDAHPANTISHRGSLTTLKLVSAWSLIANFVCVGVGILLIRFFGSAS